MISRPKSSNDIKKKMRRTALSHLEQPKQRDKEKQQKRKHSSSAVSEGCGLQEGQENLEVTQGRTSQSTWKILNPFPFSLWLSLLLSHSLTICLSTGLDTVAMVLLIMHLLPDAMAGPTPFRLQSAEAAACKSSRLKMFLNAFLVSCITILGVFICTRLVRFGRNLPRYRQKLWFIPGRSKRYKKKRETKISKCKTKGEKKVNVQTMHAMLGKPRYVCKPQRFK